jgi:hypothetical protein
VQDGLPFALKAKVSGLDDARMDGADRDLVDASASNLEERMGPGGRT